MGASNCTDSKARSRDPQTPRTNGGSQPESLEDCRKYLGMSQSDFRKMVLRSLGSGPSSLDPSEIIDLAIIGGGPGGAYTAYRAFKEFPGAKVTLFEKTQRIGGRLMSSGHHSKVREELGGMRIFPSVMENLVELVKECGLNLMPVPLSDQHNIFYYKGKHYQKGSYKCSSGRSPGQMSDDCVKKYKAAHPEQVKLKDAYLCPELRSLSLPAFFKKYGATDEEIEAFGVYGGYDLYPENVSAAIFVKDGELYGAKLSSEQKYVHEGFQELVIRMLKKSMAKVEMEMKVCAVGWNPDEKVHEITASDKHGHTKVWYARNVLASMAYDHMTDLTDTLGVSPERKEAIAGVQMLPLFKCFLQWKMEDVWWKDKGYECGKTTTDLPIRQCHYYDENDLLIYNSGPHAVYWKQQFEYSPEVARKKMFDMLKEVHQMPDMPEPIWENTLFKFWPDGSHKWKVNVDIYDKMKVICHGKGDNSHLYLCGDAYSGYQGWVVGALQTADCCWEDLKTKL